MGSITHLDDLSKRFPQHETERSLSLPELAKYGVISCLRYIQESGTCIDSADSYEPTSLQLAAELGHLKVVQHLIKGQDPRSEECTKALLAAISKGHIDMARALLDSGVGPNVMGSSTTPLKEAILGGHTSFAIYLIDRGVDVNAGGKRRSRDGSQEDLTPLQAAVDRGLEGLVKVLLIRGADPNDGPGPGTYWHFSTMAQISTSVALLV